jgi:hypothetical protein
MPVKNSTPAVPANRSIAGHRVFLYSMELLIFRANMDKARGCMEALYCLLWVKNKDVAFSMYLHWRKSQRVSELQQGRR